MVIMKTIRSFITQSYSSIRSKSKRNGKDYPDITKIALENWLYDNGLKDMWIRYIESGYDKNLRPSIDRKDDYGIYEFSNMQLITWKDNHLKGVNGIKHHNNSKNANLLKPCFIWDRHGNLLKEFKTYKDASIYLNCHLVSISRAATKKRKTLKGYIITNTRTYTSH